MLTQCVQCRGNWLSEHRVPIVEAKTNAQISILLPFWLLEKLGSKTTKNTTWAQQIRRRYRTPSSHKGVLTTVGETEGQWPFGTSPRVTFCINISIAKSTRNHQNPQAGKTPLIWMQWSWSLFWSITILILVFMVCESFCSISRGPSVHNYPKSSDAFGFNMFHVSCHFTRSILTPWKLGQQDHVT